MKHPVRIGYTTTEGDILYYEVRGSGQPLLMIAGAGGDAGFYEIAADLLADEHTVITYDRRGSSRSTKNEPQNFEISQQARDAISILHSVGYRRAHIFGNSGGAIIALELARSFPEVIDTMVVHEPPAIRLLPDSAGWLVKFAHWYGEAYSKGAQEAMASFMETLVLTPSIYYAFPSDLAQRNILNNQFFLEHEMMTIVNYLPDVSRIIDNKVKLIVAAGEVTVEAKAYYGMTASILAGLLKTPLAIFPGHHLSYIDMPEEWTRRLQELL